MLNALSEETYNATLKHFLKRFAPGDHSKGLLALARPHSLCVCVCEFVCVGVSVCECKCVCVSVSECVCVLTSAVLVVSA